MCVCLLIVGGEGKLLFPVPCCSPSLTCVDIFISLPVFTIMSSSRNYERVERGSWLAQYRSLQTLWLISNFVSHGHYKSVVVWAQVKEVYLPSRELQSLQLLHSFSPQNKRSVLSETMLKICLTVSLIYKCVCIIFIYTLYIYKYMRC